MVGLGRSLASTWTPWTLVRAHPVASAMARQAAKAVDTARRLFLSITAKAYLKSSIKRRVGGASPRR